MNKLYLIRPLTNMHAGSGEANYNIIDNEVQRDVITERPNINSSSFKGCLKAFLKNKDGISEEAIKHVFGDNNNMGQYTFFNCNLLSLPVRSNKKSFFRAVCEETLRELINTVNNFKIDIDTSILNELVSLSPNEDEGCFITFEEFEDMDDLSIEGYQCANKEFSQIQQLENILGKRIVMTSNEVFNKLTQELPVLARNYLIDRKSENLWYEEVVPRESVFYTTISIPDSDDFIEKFNKNITGDNVIQIGANASIGYGYCKIEEIKSFINNKGDKDE